MVLPESDEGQGTTESLLEKLEKKAKAKAKKDAAEERRSQFQTGGGPPINATDALSKKIIDMIPQQISPLPNPYDDDGALDDRSTKEAASK